MSSVFVSIGTQSSDLSVTQKPPRKGEAETEQRYAGDALQDATEQRRGAGVFTYKNEQWLDKLPPQTAGALLAVVGQFEKGGTRALENLKIFATPEVAKAGGKPGQMVDEVKARMFAASAKFYPHTGKLCIFPPSTSGCRTNNGNNIHR